MEAWLNALEGDNLLMLDNWEHEDEENELEEFVLSEEDDT